jgi:hypothetical protein
VTPTPPATPTGVTPPAGPTPASKDPPQTTKAPAFLDASAKHDGNTLAEWTARLGDADDLVRLAAAEAVAKYGPSAKAAVPALAKIVSNPKDTAWFPAVDAVKAVGPAAGEAVDALIGLLGNPDAGVRLTVAYALADLGPAAGKAIPALLGRLDDRAVATGGGTARDAALSAIEQVGKYDVRAVYAAARRDQLTDFELGRVIDSLGPDDAHAVAGLTAELKDRAAHPVTGNWVVFTLGGLKRIGPKAASALPAIREALNDRSPEVRRSAAEAVAAIGTEKVDAPPSPGRGGPAVGPDPAVAAVFGRASDAYRERGYKGVTLGTPFDELAKHKGLKLTRVGQPWTFASDPKGTEEFVFDAGKNLVCYTRSYDGGPDDYLDQLVDLFGRAERPSRETVTTVPTAVTRRTAVDYTFPKVLARVVFVRTAREGFPGGRPVVEEKTHVAVLDRAWATAVLDATVRGKRAALGWVRAVGEKVKGGEVVLADLPRLDGADGREFPKEREVVRFHDTKREADNTERDKARQLPAVVVAVEKAVRPGDRRPVVRVHFLFERYTPLASPAVHQRNDAPPGVPRPAPGHHPLWYTPFANLVTELNVAVARDAYPPRGEVEFVRPATGAPYYEWRTADGWLVRCRSDDAVTVEWVGDRGL